MTRMQLLKIIGFAECARSLSNECLGINEATWNMVLFVMRRHLENKLVTVTTLARAADVPYTTALRKIDRMLARGLIVKRARTPSGKSFSLHPSEELIARFGDYAVDVDRLVARTFSPRGDERRHGVNAVTAHSPQRPGGRDGGAGWRPAASAGLSAEGY